nr:hypothetical protein [Tanacetum cinerariifolium]
MAACFGGNYGDRDGDGCGNDRDGDGCGNYGDRDRDGFVCCKTRPTKPINHRLAVTGRSTARLTINNLGSRQSKTASGGQTS